MVYVFLFYKIDNFSVIFVNFADNFEKQAKKFIYHG